MTETEEIIDRQERSGKGTIFQIVPWEKRSKYFWSVEWPTDGEYDMLHVGFDEKQEKSLSRKIMALFPPSRLILIRSKRKFGLTTPYHTIPIWAKRPHDYKKGDSVEITISFHKVKNLGELGV